MKRLISILILVSALAAINQAQDLPVNTSNRGIYDFLDELANTGIIDLNSAVKPWSRAFIAEKLEEAGEQRDNLGKRQQDELDFYLRDYGKELNEGKEWDRRKDAFYFKDELFTLTVNPILGGEFQSNSNGTAKYWRNGAEAWAYIGNWTFFASLRDNHEAPLLGHPAFLTQRESGHTKGGTDWSEMMAGVTYAWEWGSLQPACSCRSYS